MPARLGEAERSDNAVLLLLGSGAHTSSYVSIMLEELAFSTAHEVTRIVELTGVAIIAVGAFGTLLLFMYRCVTGYDSAQAIANLRSSLGRAILLGLEFLVAADIINTVAVQPSLSSVAVLAGNSAESRCIKRDLARPLRPTVRTGGKRYERSRPC